jgi:hypothetical protein
MTSSFALSGLSTRPYAARSPSAPLACLVRVSRSLRTSVSTRQPSSRHMLASVVRFSPRTLDTFASPQSASPWALGSGGIYRHDYGCAMPERIAIHGLTARAWHGNRGITKLPATRGREIQHRMKRSRAYILALELVIECKGHISVRYEQRLGRATTPAKATPDMRRRRLDKRMDSFTLRRTKRTRLEPRRAARTCSHPAGDRSARSDGLSRVLYIQSDKGFSHHIPADFICSSHVRKGADESRLDGSPTTCPRLMCFRVRTRPGSRHIIERTG